MRTSLTIRAVALMASVVVSFGTVSVLAGLALPEPAVGQTIAAG